MYFIAVFAGFAVYCLVCYGFVRLIASLPEDRKRVKRRVFGFVALLIFNAPLLYYTLLPAAMKPFYCMDSGFWLYKSPEQWMRENPGVAQTLEKDGRSFTRFNEKTGLYEGGYILNQRFEWHSVGWNHWHNLQTSEQRVVDSATGEVMARRLDHGWNLPRPLMIEGAGTCFRKDDRARWRVNGKIFIKYKKQFQFLGEDI